MELEKEVKSLARAKVNVKNECERFRLRDYSFPYQYCHFCFSRFMSLRPFLLKAVQKKWRCHLLGNKVKSEEEIVGLGDQGSKSVPILDELKDMKMESECIIMGLVTKEMKNRPTILDEYLQDIEESTKISQLSNYTSDDDKLYIEDSSSRIPLIIKEGVFSVDNLISGTLVAVKGVQNSGGNFLVSDLTFASPPEEIIKKECTLGRPSQPTYLGFVSGLNIGSDIENSLSLQLFRDFILGVSSYSGEHRLLSSQIAYLIIAGNTVQLLDTAKETSTGTGTKLVVDNELLSSRLCMIDSFISQLASSISLAIMPGEDDPVPVSLPQPPFQPYIFKNSRSYQSFSTFTNPCLFSINNIRITGVSGQCISKISLFSSYSKPIDSLKFCVESRNIAPTCPDVVPSYPFFDRDPFALDYTDESFPQVIFAANQSEFGSYKFPNNGPVCFTIPEFSKTPTLVLLDINSFEFKTISFKSSPSL
ncbi:DNA polymerase delta2 [Cryptosporidium sp. chipmunk genotype I]|uniref:DNA polymerase delta2 n=1 Tax=Cryptosporidium sp. chipmunk genotype I TaxID=1280935 RepID=UPI00351A9314|nr:DNA polymerase delta2 [Cryptosporidium sp. chipmunk genotype I]